jgi:type IV fimbrial biogenesis protein FimT
MRTNRPIRAEHESQLCTARGFSTIELLVTVSIALVMAAFAIPMTKNTINSMNLNSTAVSAANTVSATRYQAIMNGYPYKVAFNPTTMKYQVSSKVPPAATFSNVGSAVPFSTTQGVTLAAATTLQFSPSGTVSATVGQMNFSLTYSGKGKKITVSNLGDVSVTDFIP